MTYNISEFIDSRKLEGGAIDIILGQVELTADGIKLPVDDETGAMALIDVVHHGIHDGITYEVSYKSPDASPIADNATVVFVLTVGDEDIHAIFDAACGGDFEMELTENVDITDGTAVIPQNKNRTRPNASTVTVVRDPTVNAAGTVLENTFGPGGTGPQASGTTGSQRNEWVLAPNHLYMYRITNRAGTAQPMALRVEWYEL